MAARYAHMTYTLDVHTQVMRSMGFDLLMSAIVLINIALMAFHAYKKTQWQYELAHRSEAFFSSVFITGACTHTESGALLQA